MHAWPNDNCGDRGPRDPDNHLHIVLQSKHQKDPDRTLVIGFENVAFGRHVESRHSYGRTIPYKYGEVCRKLHLELAEITVTSRFRGLINVDIDTSRTTHLQ
jgi:hypothetical protein